MDTLNDDASAVSARPEMPDGIHIVVVVYGELYSKLLAEITLPNLAAMVQEIPDDLRTRSILRIMTTTEDRPTIEASATLPAIRKSIRVEIRETLEMGGFDRYGGYGPMVVTQREAVLAAANVNAALFFVGPDQIYSRGAFTNFVERMRQGYRIIVGPGVRVLRDAVRPALVDRIAASADGSFALSADEQIDLLFRYWHPINDQFVIGSPSSIRWKAYIYHRPHPDEVMIRFFQGPTLVAWPRVIDGFDGFIDHDLINFCSQSWRECYIITDAKECLALDLTNDTRCDSQPLAEDPPSDLVREFFDHKAIKTMQLHYGLRTCRIFRGERSPKEVAKWKREFANAVDPLILLGLCERFISSRIGRGAALFFRLLVYLNVNSLSLFSRSIARRSLSRWRGVLPLNRANDSHDRNR